MERRSCKSNWFRTLLLESNEDAFMLNLALSECQVSFVRLSELGTGRCNHRPLGTQKAFVDVLQAQIFKKFVSTTRSARNLNTQKCDCSQRVNSEQDVSSFVCIFVLLSTNNKTIAIGNMARLLSRLGTALKEPVGKLSQ